MQIFVVGPLCSTVLGVNTARSENQSGTHHKRKHKHATIHHQLLELAIVQFFIVDIVDKIERSQSARKEKHHHAKHQVFPASDSLKTVQRSPSGNGGRLHIENLVFGHAKLIAEKHTAHSHTEQQRAEHAIDEKQRIVEACAIHIALFGAVFVGNGLNHETEQNEHPQPVGTAKTGGVEQWE